MVRTRERSRVYERQLRGTVESGVRSQVTPCHVIWTIQFPGMTAKDTVLLTASLKACVLIQFL